MKLKGKKGFVIELTIVFMLVTFGFCMVITTFVGTLSAERKYAKSEISSQTVLNQIGEYYMRSVEAGGTFPKGDEANFSGYAWMDDNGDGVFNNNDETIKFFKTHNNYRYTDKISATYGSFLDFYSTKSVYRRLSVQQGGETKMILTVKEIYVDKNTSDCEIVTWYIGDDVTAEAEDEFQETTLNILQLLWKFFGRLSGDLRDAELFSNGLFRGIFTFFNITGDAWSDIIIQGITGGVVT